MLNYLKSVLIPRMSLWSHLIVAEAGSFDENVIIAEKEIKDLSEILPDIRAKVCSARWYCWQYQYQVYEQIKLSETFEKKLVSHYL